MMKKEDLRIRQEVWFMYESFIDSGIVTGIRTNNEQSYVVIKGARSVNGSLSIKIENCYPTKRALLDDSRAKIEAEVKKYCERIRTVEDLVRFCYAECTEECANYKARKAIRIRAKELLGIDLIDLVSLV